MVRLALIVLGVLAAVSGGLVPAARAAEARKPNVIVIFTDDQGSVDAGCYGSDELVTPGLDGLAERGVRFTQFLAAAPVCSPSRVGLLTGRYPLRAGLSGNAGAPPLTGLDDGRHNRGMPSEEVTLAEMLKGAGYATAHIGKWHLGYAEGLRPSDQGFDHTFGHMGGCIDNYTHYFYWNGPNRHDLWRNGERVHYPGQFFPDLMVEEATRFIRRHRDEPFFMYFAMNVPHYPYQGEEKWLEHYEDLEYPRDRYAAFVSTLDARIKRLVDRVDAMGLREETIIIFQSDHGHSTETRAHHGGGDNGPYRGAKFSMFEGGLRVPAVISWPGHLPEGEVRDQLAHGCDWLPTIAELCGVEPPDRELDGKSLVEVIRSEGAASPHEVTHWQMGRNPKRAQWAVREGPWKLIGNVRPTGEGPKLSKQDRELFLSNLERDVSESQNLAAEHPDVVDRLKKLHTEWAEEAVK